MTSYRPPCTSDDLYKRLPTTEAEAMTSTELAEKYGYYPSSVVESLGRLEKLCANPARPDRVGTIRWIDPRNGDELQRVWLDKGDGAQDDRLELEDGEEIEEEAEEEEMLSEEIDNATEHQGLLAEAFDVVTDQAGHQKETIDLATNALKQYTDVPDEAIDRIREVFAPSIPGTGPKIVGDAFASGVQEDAAPQAPRTEPKKTLPPPLPCWQEVAAALPSVESEAMTYPDIAAKFPGLDAEGASHRIKAARKVMGDQIRSRFVAGSRYAFHWRDGPAPEIPEGGRRKARKSPAKKFITPSEALDLIGRGQSQAVRMGVESQIKAWIRDGLIVAADVRMVEDGIETRLMYPVVEA